MQKYQYINIYIYTLVFLHNFWTIWRKIGMVIHSVGNKHFFPLQYLWIRILMYGNGDRWQFCISRKFNFVTLFTDIWSKTNQILGDVMTNLTELLEIFEKKHLRYPMKLDIWQSYVKYSDSPGKVNECWKHMSSQFMTFAKQYLIFRP